MNLSHQKYSFVSSEAIPFAKTGGLGDVAGALSYALKKLGADVRVVIPKYKCIPQEYINESKDCCGVSCLFRMEKTVCPRSRIQYFNTFLFY